MVSKAVQMTTEDTHIPYLSRVVLSKLILDRHVVRPGIRSLKVILPALQVQPIRGYAQRALAVEAGQCCL